jgi:ABC-type transport system substrate-binding protein
MKKMSRLAVVISLILMLSLTLSACGGGSGESNSGENKDAASNVEDSNRETAAVPAVGEPVYGGAATVYYPRLPMYFDPGMQDGEEYCFWYETLWVMNWGLNDPAKYDFKTAAAIPEEYLMGQLADSWEFNADTGAFTVTIRDDVYFQEGEPYNGRKFVAADVVWTYSRLLGLNGVPQAELEPAWPQGQLYMLEGVEATNDTTVVFHFLPEYANEVQALNFMNVKANIAGPEWDDCPQTWEYAKGTGAFTIAGFTADNNIELVKNEKYYGYDERHPDNKLPYLDSIKLVYIEDSANVLAQSMSGDLDWFGQSNRNTLTESEMIQLGNTDSGTFTTYRNSGPLSIGLKVSQKPFDDIRVRIAMQKAIDIESIDSAYLGVTDGTVIPGLWNPSVKDWTSVGNWDSELLDMFKYDPETAKALLTEAGYPDGFEFTLSVEPADDVDQLSLVADYLSKIGIKMNIEVQAEQMEAVVISTDVKDPRQFTTYAGGYTNVNIVMMQMGDTPMQMGYDHQDKHWFELLDEMKAATTIASQSEAAYALDIYFPEQHWAIYTSGMPPSYDWMSNRIGGYSGEKGKLNGNMRTIWARLWATA